MALVTSRGRRSTGSPLLDSVLYGPTGRIAAAASPAPLAAARPVALATPALSSALAGSTLPSSPTLPGTYDPKASTPPPPVVNPPITPPPPTVTPVVSTPLSNEAIQDVQGVGAGGTPVKNVDPATASYVNTTLGTSGRTPVSELITYQPELGGGTQAEAARRNDFVGSRRAAEQEGAKFFGRNFALDVNAVDAWHETLMKYGPLSNIRSQGELNAWVGELQLQYQNAKQKDRQRQVEISSVSGYDPTNAYRLISGLLPSGISDLSSILNFGGGLLSDQLGGGAPGSALGGSGGIDVLGALNTYFGGGASSDIFNPTINNILDASQLGPLSGLISSASRISPDITSALSRLNSFQLPDASGLTSALGRANLGLDRFGTSFGNFDTRLSGFGSNLDTFANRLNAIFDPSSNLSNVLGQAGGLAQDFSTFNSGDFFDRLSSQLGRLEGIDFGQIDIPEVGQLDLGRLSQVINSGIFGDQNWLNLPNNLATSLSNNPLFQGFNTSLSNLGTGLSGLQTSLGNLGRQVGQLPQYGGQFDRLFGDVSGLQGQVAGLDRFLRGQDFGGGGPSAQDIVGSLVNDPGFRGLFTAANAGGLAPGSLDAFFQNADALSNAISGGFSGLGLEGLRGFDPTQFRAGLSSDLFNNVASAFDAALPGIGEQLASYLPGLGELQGLGSDIRGLGADLSGIRSGLSDARFDDFFRYSDIMDSLSGLGTNLNNLIPDYLADPDSLFGGLKPGFEQLFGSQLGGVEGRLDDLLSRIDTAGFGFDELPGLLQQITGETNLGNIFGNAGSELPDLGAGLSGAGAGTGINLRNPAGQVNRIDLPSLDLPTIVDQTPFLESPLLGAVTSSLGAANPYDTRRDAILAGPLAAIDKEFADAERALTSRFAVEDNLGSPAYRKALQDLQEEKTRRRLDIQSRFGEQAAASDEGIRRGRVQDLADALSGAFGRTQTQIQTQAQAQQQAVQDLYQYLASQQQAASLPFQFGDEGLRLLLGGIGSTLNANNALGGIGASGPATGQSFGNLAFDRNEQIGALSDSIVNALFRRG